jgi:hypothetical protein
LNRSKRIVTRGHLKVATRRLKKPKNIILSKEALPRNALGKVMRKDLRKKYGEKPMA